uniref:Thiamine pyrimidine synthase n=1 Tax=Chromera velia CCMP2878 TaxID=1169474 RepID=A0A0G4HQJ1_9ALVE|mmetsp:Transcript_47487/g.93634  ORF Transcript_47487/g.93634 Transcript_47487/m.93634 type:complete len:345 (+) Transcript_47487:216-1250(+)|eukprot:Cvel_7951.t1-p1 / transcript=Cvel_7951.t1 / gene=Cvel_7951 / organism=Chromera_velia_CCMP2878 / gene_product=Putative thiamine biosynthesis protein HI_0357, putative / transcript_product=Putative thiamine biosynthesis protein HI_0357, putative / location=Cvel_scaffold427:71209-72240(+) / protein_length=344 / sequence_SO=supercontig / SO=protein_coding / is_pseudo=false
MSSGPPAVIRVALDWTPNTNHIGFFIAKHKGWFKDAGLDVQFVLPDQKDVQGAELTPARKVPAGFAEFAVTPSESAISFHTSEPDKPRLVAVAALLQKSTSSICVTEKSGIERPKQLDGRKYASYVGRFEMAIVRQMVINDGGKGDVEEVPLKFHGYGDEAAMQYSSVVEASLAASGADASWIFSHWEGVMAKRNGAPVREFSLEDFGVPYGYAPVLVAHPEMLSQRSEAVKAFMDAVSRGFEYAEKEPMESAKILQIESGHASCSDLSFLEESMKRLQGCFLTEKGTETVPEGKWGVMAEDRWAAFLAFLQAHRVLTDREGKHLSPESVPEPSALFSNAFLPK